MCGSAWGSISRGQRSAISGQRFSGAGLPRGRRFFLGRDQRSADSDQRTAISGQQSADSKQRSAISGQRSADSKQRSAISGQRSACVVKNFRDLQVWHKAHQLTLMVYRLTASFPRDELYGLTTQLRRSSSSIAANLAEGCGRNGDAELARFCSIAMGSASELDYHLLLARDLGLLNAADYAEVAGEAIEVKRMLAGLIQKLIADR